MKNTYFNIEKLFERFTLLVTQILGNSITFLVAFCMVLYWWTTNLFTSNNAHQNIGDIIFGITFLSLFIIQKSFNRHTALIHLKMNELISSHETANNAVMDTSDKTEREIVKLHEEYIEMIENLDQDIDTQFKESLKKE